MTELTRLLRWRGLTALDCPVDWLPPIVDDLLEDSWVETPIHNRLKWEQQRDRFHRYLAQLSPGSVFRVATGFTYANATW